MSAQGRTRSRSRQPTDSDYRRLLGLRDGLRRFVHWSEEQAKGVGLTGAQHQLLLAIRGHGEAPSMGDVAAQQMRRHHSAVELVDRAERAGLVRRVVDEDDQRVVRLELSAAGEERLAALAAMHLEELSRLRPDLERLWAGL
jgi:DNA-binding MarR family transcriptional regulator